MWNLMAGIRWWTNVCNSVWLMISIRHRRLYKKCNGKSGITSTWMGLICHNSLRDRHTSRLKWQPLWNNSISTITQSIRGRKAFHLRNIHPSVSGHIITTIITSISKLARRDRTDKQHAWSRRNHCGIRDQLKITQCICWDSPDTQGHHRDNPLRASFAIRKLPPWWLR